MASDCEDTISELIENEPCCIHSSLLSHAFSNSAIEAAVKGDGCPLLRLLSRVVPNIQLLLAFILTVITLALAARARCG